MGKKTSTSDLTQRFSFSKHTALSKYDNGHILFHISGIRRVNLDLLSRAAADSFKAYLKFLRFPGIDMPLN